MHSRYITICVAVLSLFFLSGCGKKRLEQLQDRTKAYNSALRWSSLTAASTLIDEEVRRTIVTDLMKTMGDSRIVDFAIVDLGVDEKAYKASVIVEFSYYKIAHNDLKYRQEIQAWEYLKDKKNWFLKFRKDISSVD